MSTNPTNEEICCPLIDPSIWDERILEWKSKMFIKDKVFTIMFIPFGFGKVMKRLDEKVRAANSSMPDYLCLSDHTSSWNMDLYLAVDKEIPNATNVTLSGKFFCKVYEGSYNETGKWNKDFERIGAEKGYKYKKQYLWYTTCPKCAKKHGKNYVVFFGQID